MSGINALITRMSSLVVSDASEPPVHNRKQECLRRLKDGPFTGVAIVCCGRGHVRCGCPATNRRRPSLGVALVLSGVRLRPSQGGGWPVADGRLTGGV